MSTGMPQFDARPMRRPRGWARLWQTPIFVLGLVSLGLVAATAPLRENPTRDFARDLHQLRQTISDGQDLPDVKETIEPLLERAFNFPRHEAECELIVGTYFYQRSLLEPTNLEWRARANKHLSRALVLTVPDSDLPMLLYRLGMIQYHQDQHRAQALNTIRQGLDLGAENPAAGYAFLVEAYLKMTPPNLQAALSASERHREYVNDADAEALGGARYLHADILDRLNRHAEALVELEQIDGKVSAPLLARVRFLQAQCSEREGHWASASLLWKELDDLAEHVPGGKGRIAFARGLTQTHLEPVDEDAVLSLWKQAVAEGGEAGQAAGIRLAHRLIVGSRPDPEQALKEWTSALAGVRVPSDFKNRYLEPKDAMLLFDQAADRLAAERDFARSLALANLLTRIAPPGIAEERIARVTARWAQDLAERAEANPAEREKLLSDARSRYQDAGDSFKQATLSREAAAKTDLFWQSAGCYIAARDFTNAALVLEKFVALTKGDDRGAQGHFALAEAYQFQGQKAKAREHFLKCIELNRSPFVYRALSKLAQIEIDAKKLGVAREILVQIITRNGPDLERDILEQTMFTLAKILFDLNEPDEGAVRTTEAIRQFPKNPQVSAAREKLAEHAWERGKQISLTEIQALGPDRRPFAESMLQKRRAHLQEAHDAYLAIANELEETFIATKKISGDDAQRLRVCLFNVGDIKIEMGSIAEAFDYFRALQTRCKGKHESLQAILRIHHCWRQIALQPADRVRYKDAVLEAVRTALNDLELIPRSLDDEFLSGPHPYSREQWRALLQHWDGELMHIALRPNVRGFAPQE